ncbi:MAG: retroviral-like aspartic protease family protein [Gemmatimonadota bacterium]|nr:retroviral-like aspartic protease family protein [Gemmatimonadota bacterium]
MKAIRALSCAPRRVLLLGLLAGGAAACTEAGRPAAVFAPADSAAGELAFRLAGPGGAALVVPAFVNGRGPVELILDTGATLTCLDTALVREFGLPERRAVLGAAVGVRGAGRVRLVRVDSLRVGAASARGLTACALDLRALRSVGPEIRGLLGLNFLRSFRVTLDFEREVLRLTRPQN